MAGESGPSGPRTADPRPAGDPARHLALDALERGLRALAPPAERGRLALIVSRRDEGVRETPASVELTLADGVPGDAWARRLPRSDDAQVTLMRADVATLLANGQPLTLFGDNLLVELDLSARNLPTGSRLGVGGAVLEVTAKPHRGCAKFRQRFGDAALLLTADARFLELRLRGIYARVVGGGKIAADDRIEVLSRG